MMKDKEEKRKVENIHNPGLDHVGATHFFNACLGHDPNFGNHWVRQKTCAVFKILKVASYFYKTCCYRFSALAALNHNLFGFVSRVITDLSSGKHAGSGCTLRFIMDWAWKSVALIKERFDEICTNIATFVFAENSTACARDNWWCRRSVMSCSAAIGPHKNEVVLKFGASTVKHLGLFIVRLARDWSGQRIGTRFSLLTNEHSATDVFKPDPVLTRSHSDILFPAAISHVVVYAPDLLKACCLWLSVTSPPYGE